MTEEKKQTIRFKIVARIATNINRRRNVPAGYILTAGEVRHPDEINHVKRIAGSAWTVEIHPDDQELLERPSPAPSNPPRKPAAKVEPKKEQPKEEPAHEALLPYMNLKSAKMLVMRHEITTLEQFIEALADEKKRAKIANDKQVGLNAKRLDDIEKQIAGENKVAEKTDEDKRDPEDIRNDAIAELSKITGIAKKTAGILHDTFSIKSLAGLLEALSNDDTFDKIAEGEEIKASAKDLGKWYLQAENLLAATNKENEPDEDVFLAEKFNGEQPLAIYIDEEGNETNDPHAAKKFDTFEAVGEFITENAGKYEEFAAVGHTFAGKGDE